MTTHKPIMRAYVPISREGRFLLTLIVMLLLVVLVGITFVIKGQEAQGEMLNQTIEATEQIQATVDEIQTANEFIGDFSATAYCAGFGNGCAVCGTDGVTATGTKCSPIGNEWVTIAVDPRVIAYGTKLKIVIGDTIIYGIAEDTGGFAQGLYPQCQIDVCCSNHEEAIQFGVAEVELYKVKGK